MISLLLLFFFLTCAFGQQTFNVTMTVPAGVDGDNPLVAAVVNSTNVGILYCGIIGGEDGNDRQSQWSFIIPGQSSTLLIFAVDGTSNNPDSENFMTTILTDFRRNLTILNFTKSFNNTQIGCGFDGNVLATFDLKIIRLPRLLQESLPHTVMEGAYFQFTIQSVSGIPTQPESYNWFKNNEMIQLNNVNPFITDYPNITFTSVHRNDSGNYSISVTNGAGTANGYFILDVQYGPEGVVNAEGTRHVLVGTNVTIIGFSSINGNPSPSSSWSLDGSAVVSGGRITTDINGQLSISSVQLNDTGNYTNTLMNTVTGQDMSIDNTVELIIAGGPTMPRSVTVLNVGPEYVNISWVNPLDIGTPVPLHQYTVTVVSSVNTVSMTVTDVNTSDPDYINSLVLYGLKPNTLYNVTVQGTSTVTELGDLMGDSSEPVSFNTTLGAPRFSSSILVSSNGNLSVSWQFLHTGGGAISSITVQCFSTVDDELLPASAAPLSTIFHCTGSVQCDTSTDIGPVTTGMNYSCIVAAENSVGFDDEMRTNYVIANTGLPSEAVLISVVGGAGSARIILRVDHYGVTDVSQFFFTITVYSDGSVVDQRTVSPDDISNPVITLDIDGIPAGMVSFTISTSNIYGSPLTMNNATTSVVMVTPITSTTSMSSTAVHVSTTASTTGSPTATPTGSMKPSDTPTAVTSSDGLSGGVIAAIAIIVIAVVAIISVLVCAVVVYKLKVKAKAVDASKPTDIRTDVNEAYQLMNVPSSPTPATGSVLVQDNIAYQQITINTKRQDTSAAIYETVYGQN